MGARKWPPNPHTFVAPREARGAPRYLERETGFEPATPSLEGWRSTAELFPRIFDPSCMVGRGGIEPPKVGTSRFTVCPLWPLGYLPENGMWYANSLQTLENAGAGGRI